MSLLLRGLVVVYALTVHPAPEGADNDKEAEGAQHMATDSAAVPYGPLSRIVEFHIADNDAKSALIAFGEQAELTVLISQDARDAPVAGLLGTFQVRNALDRLMEGSGLEYRIEGEGIIISRRVAEIRLADAPAQADSGAPTDSSNGWLRKVVGVLAVGLTASPVFSAESADGEKEEVAKTETEERTEEIVVVGTRLAKGDPTAHVEVIDYEEIKALGVLTAEDIIRTIPANQSGHSRFSPQTQMPDLWTRDQSIRKNHGTSTANLRGLGSANTLVLVNGKRIAAAAGEEALFANIRHIPASAIERVEVHLDGGSAIFGSEASGGTINIVLRDDYVGIQVNVRKEHSSTGGHGQKISMFAGYNWPTGNITLLGSLDEYDPVTGSKTGYTTRDHSDRYGGDDRYDFRYLFWPRSGLVRFSRWGRSYAILPLGNDGRNAQPEDFLELDFDADIKDRVPRYIGGFNDDHAYTLNAEQRIGSRLRLDAELYQSSGKTEFSEATEAFLLGIAVPASNAFNNFGRTVWVNYSPEKEAELGMIPDPRNLYEGNVSRYGVGMEYDFRDGLKLHIDYSRSQSTGKDIKWGLSPGRTEFSVLGQDPEDLAVQRRIEELMASDDPNEAINYFGDGTGQNPTIAEVYTRLDGSDGTSFVESLEGYLTIDLIELPAGTLGLVLGAERRRDWVEDNVNGRDHYLQRIGVTAPEREFSSVFGEVRIPVVSDSRLFALQDLTLSAQLHYDRYVSTGGVAKADDVLQLGQSRFTNTSRRVGLMWAPVNALTVRMSVSEAFRPPLFTQLFVANPGSSERYVWDALLRDSVHGIATTLPSNDLLPETSTTKTVQLDWRPERTPGLSVGVTWNNVDSRDRVVHGARLARLLPVEIYGNMTEFHRRDTDGTLLEYFSKYINISRRYVETINVDLDYRFPTKWGSVDAGLDYHKVLDYFEQGQIGFDPVSFLGQSVGLDRYKIRGHLGWTREPYSANLFVNYRPGYLNNSIGQLDEEDVDSHTTVDASGTYAMENGLTFRLGARNLFDADLPYHIGWRGRPWDPGRADLRKRVLYLEAEYNFRLF